MPATEEKVTFFHVLHSKQDEKWHVKEGSGGTITAHRSKDEAVEKAIELAQNVRNTKRHVIIHKTNGAFEAVRDV